MTETLDQLGRILGAITDGILVVDGAGRVLYANASAERIFERGTLAGQDLAIPVQPERDYMEINLVRPSGLGWAEFRANPIDWGGVSAFVIGVRDITDRKKLEERLRLAVMVFDSAGEGFMVTDEKRQILQVNRAFSEITGYSEAEVIGQLPVVLNSGQHGRAFYAAMYAGLERDGRWQGEIWNRRKNGEIYPEWLSITVLRNEEGRVVNYLAGFSDISKLKSSESQLEFLAHHDPLTRLPNRVFFISRLAHAIEAQRRDGKRLALLMIDLDRFKDVNDSFGHAAGDELLQLVSDKLMRQLREMDTVCRLGGDEFVVLLEKLAEPEHAAKVAEDIIRELGKPWRLSNGAEVRIGLSVGISIYPDQGGTTPEMLLQQADSALYQAKTEGRGRFVYFTERFTLAARKRIELEVRLRHALDMGELRVYYQPQVDINTGKIVGAEALVRWQDPNNGLVAPGEFIQVAEQIGLVGEIDEWVLHETCLQGKRWLDAGLPPMTLAVNLSPYQFLSGNLGDVVAGVLQHTAYPANWLELELTESALMQRETEAIATLDQLRVLGVRLAIDDFGTGYSSLAYLKLFPLDVLKIDKKFIDDVPLHRDDMEIVTAIIAMAHTLRLRVLAEGVENDSQLSFLRTKGCDLYQGYLSSKPLPADEFERLLRGLR